MVSSRNARILDLTNVKQDRTQGAQVYIQRVVHIADIAYITVDRESQVARKQM